MIRHIRIRDFAIIKDADIDFYDGLNIVTGETGAGKSIVIEAVSLALGSRADAAFVRSGADKATVQMVADLNGKEYIITREVTRSGRNTCRINDEIVTLSTLNSLCKKLADIHGQYDHQSLLNAEYHIGLVDLYRKDIIQPSKARTRELFEKYSSIKKEISVLNAQLSEGKRQQDFMAFELQEIREANLQLGEDDKLNEEIYMLQNSEKIFQNLASAYRISSEDEYSLLSAMKQVSDMVSQTAAFSGELDDLSRRLTNLYYEYEDACTSIRECRDHTVFDPQALDMAISRSEIISKLKGKHGKDIEELLAYADELEEKLSRIDNADDYLLKLTAELNITEELLAKASKDLSQARRESAAQLQELIIAELKQLNFGSAELEISFADAGDYSPEGTDIVEFLITTNRGEPLKPLSKIASGGEMSRIMLAFKKIIGDYDEIPTMIFDEIDSGISGITASIVGRKLCEIATNHQIICITHLPQIAAFGKNNYRISKHTDDSMTYTTIDHLSEDGKVSEIARLLGGENITETTMASARELVASSKQII